MLISGNVPYTTYFVLWKKHNGMTKVLCCIGIIGYIRNFIQRKIIKTFFFPKYTLPFSQTFLNSIELFQTLIVQVWCYKEIINIGHAVYRVHGLPWFRSLSWWFLITSNYFFYGESLVSDYFGLLFSRNVSVDFYVILWPLQ